LPFLKKLRAIRRSPFEVKKRTLGLASREELLCIISILLNYYLANIPIAPGERKKLRCWRPILSSILSKRTGLVEKRKEILANAPCIIQLVSQFLEHE